MNFSLFIIPIILTFLFDTHVKYLLIPVNIICDNPFRLTLDLRTGIFGSFCVRVKSKKITN